MSEDKRRILEMLSQSKITVEEAEKLLAAVEPQPDATGAAPEGGKRNARWLRISVDKPTEGGARKKEVNVRIPVTLVRAGVRLGAMFPRLVKLGEDSVGLAAGVRAGNESFDFAKIDPKQ